MILEVFAIFIAICFILIFIGFYTEIKVVALIAFVGIFLLGLILQAGAVSSTNGYTTTNHYACTSCSESRFLNNTGNESVVASYDIVYNTTPIDDATSVWLGRWLAFAGALGFILTIVTNRDTDITK